MRGKKISVLSLSIMQMLSGLGSSITFPFLPIYLHGERGYPMATVGIVFLANGLANIIGSPIGGYLTDRFGRKVMLVSGPGMSALLFAGLAWLTANEAPFLPFCILLAAVSFFGMFFTNALRAMVTDSTAPEERGGVFSRLQVGLNMGWTLGPAIGAFLARTPFYYLFGFTAFFNLVVALYMLTVPVGPTAKSATAEKVPFFKTLRQDGTFLRLLILSFLMFLVFSQLFTTFSVFATQRVGISSRTLGFLYTFNGCLLISLQLPLERLFRKVALGRVIAMGCLLYAVGYFSLAFAQNWFQLGVSTALFTLGEVFTLPLLVAAVSRVAKPHAIGRYMGIYGLCRAVAQAIGPWAGGNLYDMLPQNPMLMWGLIALPAVAAAVGFYRRSGMLRSAE